MASSGQAFLDQRLDIPSSVGSSRTQILNLVALPNELLIEILACLPTKDLLLSVTLVCRQFQDMILSIVHARLLQFYPPKNLPLTLNCCHPAALMDTFRGLCPPATYIDTPGLASDISCTSESNSRHAAWNDGSSLLYSHFVLQGQNIRPVHMDSDEPFFQFCTTLSLSTHVSLSNTVSWLVTRKRTKRLMRAWLAKCATRRLHSAAADKGKQDASDEIQCSNSRSSSEDNIHTMWTDQSENFGLRIRIEDRTLAERSADYRANIHGVEQAASYDMHIQGFIIRSPFLLLRIEAVNAARENLLIHTPRLAKFDKL